MLEDKIEKKRETPKKKKKKQEKILQSFQVSCCLGQVNYPLYM